MVQHWLLAIHGGFLTDKAQQLHFSLQFKKNHVGTGIAFSSRTVCECGARMLAQTTGICARMRVIGLDAVDS